MRRCQKPGTKNSGTTPSPAEELPGGQVLRLEAAFHLAGPTVALLPAPAPRGPGSRAPRPLRGLLRLGEGGGVGRP